MTGLRERKKVKTRKSILKAAAEIISKKGFDNTTIEEVAEQAEVGVGTVYNYFGSKSDLLIAIFNDETEKIIAAGNTVIENHLDDMVTALDAIINNYLDGLLSIDQRLLTEAIRVGFSRVGMEATAFMELDYKLIGKLAELLADFQARGLVNTNHTPQDQALAIYSGIMTQVMMVVYTPDMAIENARDGMRKHLEIIAQGLLVLEKGVP